MVATVTAWFVVFRSSYGGVSWRLYHELLVHQWTDDGKSYVLYRPARRPCTRMRTYSLPVRRTSPSNNRPIQHYTYIHSTFTIVLCIQTLKRASFCECASSDEFCQQSRRRLPAFGLPIGGNTWRRQVFPPIGGPKSESQGNEGTSLYGVWELRLQKLKFFLWVHALCKHLVLQTYTS